MDFDTNNNFDSDVDPGDQIGGKNSMKGKKPDLKVATYDHTHFVTFYLDSLFVKSHLSSYVAMSVLPFLELLLQIDEFLVLKPFQIVNKQLIPSIVESSSIPTLILFFLVPIVLFYSTLAKNVT